MSEDSLIVIHGFLELTAREKMKVVEAMNDYFDNIDRREEIRAEYERQFGALDVNGRGLPCKCCGRT